MATFASDNGAGTVALVAVGAAASGLALIGRWPSRVVVSGNEVEWEEIRETLDSQIAAAQDDTDNRAVIAELVTLRSRLRALERTGDVAEHPAARYDYEVRAAVLRVRAGAEIFAEPSRSGDRPDFTVRWDGRVVLVETKWRGETDDSFYGSTLSRLTGPMGPADRLLVVSNATNVGLAGQELEGLIGPRGRLVRWRGPTDDPGLAEALNALLGHGPT